MSMICNIQSIAEFVAVMRGTITKKIGAWGSQNLRGDRIKGFLFAGPKRGGRNNGVAVRRCCTVKSYSSGFFRLLKEVRDAVV